MLIGYSDRMQKIVNNYHDFISMKSTHSFVSNVQLPYLRVGDKVHIKSRRGVYVIVMKCHNSLKITCNKWQEEFKRGDRNSSNTYVPNNDFQCKYGEGKSKN